MRLNHISGLFGILTLSFSMLAAPGNIFAKVDSTPSPVAKATTSSVKKQNSQVKKQSARASSKSSANSQKAAKPGASKNMENSAAKSRAVKSGKTSEVKQSAANSNDRDVWLKRSKNSEVGKASWYGKDFHNKATASGVAYDMHTFTAAHRTLPLGTVVKVTDERNGKSVMLCVTDRGPYVRDRIIDVSYAAADKLDLKERGVGKVRLEVVGDEHGNPLRKDQAYFVKYASGNGNGKVGPFHAFADAAAMHEALRQAHPEAEVVLDKNTK